MALPTTLRAIAGQVDGAIVGNGDVTITGFAAIGEAQEGDLSFISNGFVKAAVTPEGGERSEAQLFVGKGTASHVMLGLLNNPRSQTQQLIVDDIHIE